jgi:hypothetical protein
MPNQKAKSIRARLEQIKDRAAQMNANDEAGADLAEEAAALGLELDDLHNAKKKEK